MPSPLLLRLPKSARIAYPLIQAGTRRGLSSRAIERTVRDAGLSISRTRSILPIMREVQAQEAYASRLRNVNKGSAINVNRIPESITFQRRAYSFVVRVNGYDQIGNYVSQFVQVSTDNPNITPSSIEQGAQELLESLDSQYNIAAESFTIESATRRGVG